MILGWLFLIGAALGLLFYFLYEELPKNKKFQKGRFLDYIRRF